MSICHIVPSSSQRQDGAGALRQYFCVGRSRRHNNLRPGIHTRFTVASGVVARGPRLHCASRINEVYKGVEIVKTPRPSAANRHSLPIEVRDRGTLMDRTRGKTIGASRVQADINHPLIENGVRAFAAARGATSRKRACSAAE